MPVAGAAAGYLIDRKMGGNGLSGAMMGGSLGYGGMGSGASAGGAAGGKGANTAATSLNAGTALGSGGMASAQGASTLGLGSALGTPATTGILGSSTNAIPSYDIGMEGVKANIGGFTAPQYSSQAVTNSYMPFTNSAGEAIAPNMSATQTFADPNLGINTSNAIKDPLTGQAVAPSYDLLPNLEETPLYTGAESPNFANIQKSSPTEIAEAQGGFEGEKPLYEKAFDSVMGFAQKNPIALATLGMTALGGGSSASPQQVTQSAGKIAQQTYNPNKERILNIRRA